MIVRILPYILSARTSANSIVLTWVCASLDHVQDYLALSLSPLDLIPEANLYFGLSNTPSLLCPSFAMAVPETLAISELKTRKVHFRLLYILQICLFKLFYYFLDIIGKPCCSLLAVCLNITTVR